MTTRTVLFENSKLIFKMLSIIGVPIVSYCKYTWIYKNTYSVTLHSYIIYPWQ